MLLDQHSQTVDLSPSTDRKRRARKTRPQKPRNARRAKALALTGIFMSMFVSMLTMTVVGTSMPVIMGDLGGTQTALTWVVTATMLASAIAAPIWGKLADLTNKKHLLQAALIIFTTGSILAGFASSSEWLIGFRVIQGIGVGGLGALGQIVMADVINPRERGRYMGIASAVMSVATVGGPLLGGLITDTIGWRWNFFVTVPIAIITIFVLQFTLRIEHFKRKVKVDYLGAIFITLGFGSLLIWVSLGGTHFAWTSSTSIVLAAIGFLSLIALIVIESKVAEPVIPLTLFRNRTFTLSAIASISVGIAMFSTSVFLGQYLQLARGKTPLESGLLTIPMVFGTLLTSTLAGQLISRTGKWKGYLVTGSILTVLGAAGMSLLRHDTPYLFVAIAMFVLGAGVGVTMQNLVLVVQNTSEPENIGAASSNINFFRTIGGTSGMAVMGAVVGVQVVQYLREGFLGLGEAGKAMADRMANTTIPKLSELPPRIQFVFEDAYGHAIGQAFGIAIPFALIGLIATLFLPNVPLGTKTTGELLREKQKVSLRAMTGRIATIGTRKK